MPGFAIKNNLDQNHVSFSEHDNLNKGSDMKDYERFKTIMHRRRSTGSTIIRGLVTRLKIKRLR